MFTPNAYQLKAKNLSVAYWTSRYYGKPFFEYQDDQGKLTFKDEEIYKEDARIGSLVTVTIRRTWDSGFTTFTLLLPNVTVAGPNEPVQIRTEGITTFHEVSSGPKPNAIYDYGQTKIYSVTELVGSAERLTEDQ